MPIELGNLTVKKLQAVKLKGNPLADARIRRFVDEDTPTLVKDLLNHVRKNGYKGEAAAGGKKEEEEEEERRARREKARRRRWRRRRTRMAMRALRSCLRR